MLFWWISRNFDNLNLVCIISQETCPFFLSLFDLIMACHGWYVARCIDYFVLLRDKKNGLFNDFSCDLL
jgi:hypothetical protein